MTTEAPVQFPRLSARQLLVLAAVLPERPSRGLDLLAIAWPDRLAAASREALSADVEFLVQAELVSALSPRPNGPGVIATPDDAPPDQPLWWLTETALHGHIAEDMQAFVSDPTGEQLTSEAKELYRGPDDWHDEHASWVQDNVRCLNEALLWTVAETASRPIGWEEYSARLLEDVRAENARQAQRAQWVDSRIREVALAQNLMTVEELFISASLAVGREDELHALRAWVLEVAARSTWVCPTDPLGPASLALFPMHRVAS